MRKQSADKRTATDYSYTTFFPQNIQRSLPDRSALVWTCSRTWESCLCSPGRCCVEAAWEEERQRAAAVKLFQTLRYGRNMETSEDLHTEEEPDLRRATCTQLLARRLQWSNGSSASCGHLDGTTRAGWRRELITFTRAYIYKVVSSKWVSYHFWMSYPFNPCFLNSRLTSCLFYTTRENCGAALWENINAYY